MKYFGKEKKIAGSLTVEAAVVVSTVLITIASMLLMEFRLHDRLAAQNALYYALENYSYRNPDTDSIEQISRTANADSFYILNSHPSVSLSPGLLTYEISGEISSDKNAGAVKTGHVRTETLLRASVLLELKNIIGGADNGKSKKGSAEK